MAGTAGASKEQSVSEPYAARLGYTFNGTGYILFGNSQFATLPDAAPAAVTFWLHGDGSGHRVAFRLNDSSDERFVAPSINVNWTGWKKIEVASPETWNHYLGNNDGKFDLPVRSLSIELTNVGGDAPRTGALFLDDVTFYYDGQGEAQATSFDPPQRKMRLWMLPDAETTVVLGRGLSPTLPKTAACVVARRKSTATSFVTLLEPFRDTPRVTTFTRDASGRFTIEGAGFRDTFRLDPDGVKEFVRTR